MSASRGRLAIALAAAAAGIALVSWLEAAPARKPAYPTRFPAGAGRALAERSCLTCHSAMLVTQQHKDSTGWEKSLKQMETWGVKLTPAERDTLVAYLRTRFGAAREK